MRILVLHSRYVSSGPASGENRVVEDELRLLRDAGHSVEAWTPVPQTRPGLGRVATATGAVWSRQVTAKVRNLIRRHRIEVVHCHNIFPALSPAVLSTAAEEAGAVVMTLHNYRYMCLPGTLWRDGGLCHDCVGRTPWPGIVHACYRKSRLGSAALAASLSVHRWLGTLDRASVFLPVSGFVLSKYVEAGWPAARMRVKHNFAWSVQRRRGPGQHFLYLGRLTPEKGVDTLLEAWRGVRAKLVVVGEGPCRRELEAAAPANVTFTGPVAGERVSDYLANARALLVPSRWPEPEGRVAIEAFAMGVPVLASAVGGTDEIVEDHVSGLLLPAGEPTVWARAVEHLMDDGLSERLGDGAYATWELRYTPERGLEELESAYAFALAHGQPPIMPGGEKSL